MVYAFLFRLPQRLVACYRGYRWAWQVLAAFITAGLIFSGFDWWFFEHTRDVWRPFILMAGLGGFYMPIAIALGLYAVGRRHAGVAVGQASFLALVISTFYKVFAGRVQPEYLTHVQTFDYSHVFHFGIYAYSIFWGWPSSHAATAVAGMTALYILWPNTLIRALCIVWAMLVCTGAAVGFHWFSDVVAGIVIGAVIGITVSKDSQMIE